MTWGRHVPHKADPRRKVPRWAVGLEVPHMTRPWSNEMIGGKVKLLEFYQKLLHGLPLRNHATQQKISMNIVWWQTRPDGDTVTVVRRHEWAWKPVPEEFCNREGLLWEERFNVGWDGELGQRWGVRGDFHAVHCCQMSLCTVHRLNTFFLTLQLQFPYNTWNANPHMCKTDKREPKEGH